MIETEWAFGVDTGKGTHIFTVAVDAAAGIAFSALDDETFSNEVVSGPDYAWSHTFTPPHMTAGFLLVDIVVDANRGFGPGHIISASYGGADVPINAATLDTAGHVSHAIGYLPIGNNSAFNPSTLIIAFSGVANSAPMTVGIHVVFFEGIEQDVTPLLSELGDADTFTTPLAVDPSPSAIYDIVITSAGQARGGSSVTVTTTNAAAGSFPFAGLWERVGTGYSEFGLAFGTYPQTAAVGAVDSRAVFGSTLAFAGGVDNLVAGGWTATPMLVIGFDVIPTFTSVTVTPQVGSPQTFQFADAIVDPDQFTYNVSGLRFMAWPITSIAGLFVNGQTTALAFNGGTPTALTFTLDTTAYFQDQHAAESPLAAEALGWFGCDVSYNCACETDPEAKTLSELRVETLKLTGYAMQANNPPPGVKEQYNALLRTSQSYLYQKYRALETERFFSWTLTPGIRYYGLRDNRNCCEVKLNKYRITGAWLQDLNNVWWPLIYGIDPTFYTLNVNFGWPAFYEIRQCIEIFPAPQAAYTLWIKGHFSLLPFEDDADITTINPEIVKNWAVFLAKSGKGAGDAALYSLMVKDQVGQLISGAHVSKRYIPGTSEIPVPTPPIMVHFDA